MRKLDTARLVLWTAGMLAFVVMWSMGGNAKLQAKEEPSPSGLELVSHDALGFLTLDVVKALKDEEAKDLLKKLDAKGSDWKKGFREAAGLDLQEIERFTLVLPSSFTFKDEPLTIIRTLKPLNKEAVRTATVKKGKEKTVNGKTYYEGSNPYSESSAAVTFVGDCVMVLGSGKGVKEFLERPSLKKNEDLLEKARSSAEKETLVFALNLGALNAADLKQMLPPDAKSVEPLFAAKSGLLTILSSADTRADFQFTFANAENAKEGAKAAQAALELLGAAAAQYRELWEQLSKEPITTKGVNKWGAQRAAGIMKVAEDGLKEAKPVQKDRTVQVTGRVKVSASALMLTGASLLEDPKRTEK
jgi:hypothetical protein